MSEETDQVDSVAAALIEGIRDARGRPAERRESPEEPERSRRRPNRGRYFCLAMMSPLILSYVAFGTIFFCTSSSFPL